MSTSPNSHPTSPSSTTSSPTHPPPISISTTTTAIQTAASTSSPTKVQAALDSLTTILPTPPSSLTSTSTTSTSPSPPAFVLLTSPEITSQISSLLRHPSSGSGDNHLCRWLYDTFHSSDPSLQIIVLRFVPLISGLYLTRITHRPRQPLAGFEAILLALYAHETTTRNNHPITVTIPDLSHPSIYHESSSPQRNNSTDLNIAVISSSLEPHGTIRSTRRARIVGVALELFFGKICVMPTESKLDFCEFLYHWAGSLNNNDNDNNDGQGRILLPWELLGPCLRILGHCLLGKQKEEELLLREKGYRACKSLYNRVMHDVNPKAILAVGSLLRLVNMEKELDEVDYTEIQSTRVISI
ncbi:location of vulva defective 1-like [Chenopodium quinoa]|uniref:location of vulva defective 1-like n=1 Tax=Chenopodium quinoa TaxID=63459 RepID=UPI000B78B469|nr:location of vulva defective 1-like [Chenopodium quinoa]